MATEFIPFGKPYPALSSDHLVQAIARKTVTACQESKDYEVIELRYLIRDDENLSDIIVVDCVNDQVPTRNIIGIKVRERLALVFTPGKLPEVRAIRKDFPIVPHLYHVPHNEPASLCLYEDTWSGLERTWTPQTHLRRIIWWLSETAKGTLHRDDQPVEPIYFESLLEIVLPPDFEEKIKNPNLSLMLIGVEQSNNDIRVIRGKFLSKNKARTHNVPQIIPLMLELMPLVHGSIERYPKTLGQICDQFAQRGIDFFDNLKKAIKENSPVNGLSRNLSERCLMVLSIPIKRDPTSDPEKYDIRAFQLNTDFVTLGEKVGVLTSPIHDGKYYATSLVGDNTEVESTGWSELELVPVNVKIGLTKSYARRASDIDENTANFKGVLAGVGALGSALAELWAKEYWGEWSLVDPDFIKSHNIVRHIGKDFHIGWFKVDVVKQMVEMNYHDDYYPTTAIPKDVNKLNDEEVKQTIITADFFIDSTTTIEVPRDTSQKDNVPRSSSVFLTPSGQSSVLLIETADRTVRLDGLEAQYYRAIINSDWGANHLDGHRGEIRVGAGCRDVSVIMSNEMIQFHAALLARQVRLLRDQPAACIRVWVCNCETGAVEAHEIPVHETLCFQSGEWRIILDTEIKQRLCKIRMSHLPNETGGVILGYIDQKLKAIYIVDTLEAPPDSKATQTGFTRGIEGLDAVLKEAARRTANIVSYIGEWHSHTAFTSPCPSCEDRDLIKELAYTVAIDGQPALMMIVGAAEDISISVKEGY